MGCWRSSPLYTGCATSVLDVAGLASVCVHLGYARLCPVRLARGRSACLGGEAMHATPLLDAGSQ